MGESSEILLIVLVPPRMRQFSPGGPRGSKRRRLRQPRRQICQALKH